MEKFERVVANIKANGVEMEPLVIVADVSTDAERIIAETIEKYGRLDILINNAGFSIYGTLENMKMEDYDGKSEISYIFLYTFGIDTFFKRIFDAL